MAGAAAYSSSLINETDADSQKVLSLIWRSGLKSWRKRFVRYKIKVHNGVYPAHLESLWIVMAFVMALHFSSYRVPYDLTDNLVERLPKSSLDWQLFSCFAVSMVIWIIVCLIMRYTLKLLLVYKGFMFETRGKGVSLMTSVWGLLVKVFVKWNSPSLYSFQGSLPHLPLPSVRDTITRYLNSVRPLLNDADYEKVKKQSDDFLNGIANKLQRYLFLKSWWASNYVSDWWEEYVYLRNRDPLMYGSNYYGSDVIEPKSKNQTARAANLTYLMLQFRRQIEHQKLKPIMVQGLVPLCSFQYERMFNTARVPGIEGDKIVHYDDIKHIVVLHKGCYYSMPVHHNGRWLNSIELQYQLDQIINRAATSSTAEKYLASLTAWNRTKWAQTRDKYFATGMNKTSLEAIESAAFVLILEEDPFKYDLKSSPTEYGFYGRQLLHGKGYDRWFDKSFNFCVGSNGKTGLNGEHTWGDAPVLAQMFEDCLFDDNECYDEFGNLKGKLETKPPSPSRLEWDFRDQELVSTINEAFVDSQKIINDVDHQILVHSAFGKGLIKTCRISPDAFIQMALQLAYYRDYGNFQLTYEASMTRLFREGRTETVRPCTIEAAKWVKAMEDKSSNSAERVRLLNKACTRHQQGYLDAMCGRGIDRHLFCLYVVSKYLEIDSPFLKEALSQPWKLSTSQTPLSQTPKIDIRKKQNLRSASGGFGPVSREGYSVSYIISGEDLMFFHVSSVKSCEITDTDRFVKNIVKAMNDIKLLFEDFNDKKNH